MFWYDFQGVVSQRDDGTPVRRDQLGGYTVEVDLSEQVLGLEILEELQLGGGGRRGVEPRVIPSIADLLPAYTSFGQRVFVSASMLAQKAKQFDDGLYATVALAAQQGNASFAVLMITTMEQLFLGAYVTVMRELGLDPGTTDKQTVAAAAYADWANGCGEDPDLGQDARAMVPIFYDIERCKTKVWLFLGWSTQHLDVTFSRPPRVTIVDETGTSLPPESMDIKIQPVYEALIHPVTAETYVEKILDRKEFQRHCDEFKTMRRIVDALH